MAQGAPDDACIENIDIGGPALIRAAAKNHDFVTVLIDPDQYAAVLDEIAATWRHYAGAAPPSGRRGLCSNGNLRRGDRGMVRRTAWRAVSPARGDRRHAASDAALWREPASGSRILRHRRTAWCCDRGAGAGQGTLLQQSERHRRGVRVRRRVRRADGGDHQACQSVRRGECRDIGRGVGQGVPVRSGLAVRRHRRGEPPARCCRGREDRGDPDGSDHRARCR